VADDRRVLIVGGGIGGLAVATGLRRAGVPIGVYERAPAILELGVAVGLQAGAINALARLGLGDGLREIASTPAREIRVFSYRGKQLATWPQFGASVGVHRGELIDVLKQGVGDDSVIHCGRNCVDVRQDADGVTAIFEDGSEERGSVLIGADGQRSVVRRALWGETGLRYSGYVEWRALANARFDEVPDGSAKNVLGPGGAVGMMACSEGRTHWFAKMARPEGQGDPPEGRKQDVLDTFSGWTTPIRELFEATPEEAIDRQDVFDRVPLKTWSRGRITLLGDAAHPTTPSLGAGAGITIEDAPVLTNVLGAVSDLGDRSAVERALAEYERERVPPTTAVVNASWKFSKVVTARHPAQVWLRELLLPLIPERYWRRNVERNLIIDLTREPSAPAAT
jgi:2-polyprenyl-6-methoxyphenol hydroxylase-like FAD-dependent oxidoreductase